MKEKIKKEKNKNLPIATEIIKDYKTSNKRLFIIAAVLLTVIFVETTYLVLLLDSLNNSVGLITEEVKQCD